MAPGAHVLVLGAGMVGVSTALALRQRGHPVTLVDRAQPGRETSYGNAGIIQREAVQPYAFPRDLPTLMRMASGRGNEARYTLLTVLGMAPRLARYWANSAQGRYAPIAQAYEALIAHCLTEHAHWMAQADAEDLVSRQGWQQAYRSPKAFAQAAQAARQVAERSNLALEILDSTALARSQPALMVPMAGALHWKDPWTVSDPGELVDRYVALYRRLGGNVAVGDARTLRAQGSAWAVDTESGVIDVPHVVIALGPWSDSATRALGYRLQLFVKRGYHRHYSGGAVLKVSLLDVERGVMLAPMKRGLRLATGAEFAAHEAARSPVQLVRGETSSRELLNLGQPVEREPWMGARPCTSDMLPVVGAAPKHPGLWFNFGHGHQGFTLGPASGRLLAELMRGDTPYVDPAPYSPARF